MAEGNTIGQTIQRLRKDKEMSLSELARQAEISKAYLSQIERGRVRRPSGETLYRIASVLGTSVGALLGRGLPDAEVEVRIPGSLQQFAKRAGLDEEEVGMLARIRHRGRQPLTVEDWQYVYESIKRSVG